MPTPSPISQKFRSLKNYLKSKFPKSKKIYFLRFGLFVMSYAMIIFVDLHYLGNKNDWNTFDKIRIKTYLKSVIYVGYITPPIGPLRMVHYSSRLGNAFLKKEMANPPLLL